MIIWDTLKVQNTSNTLTITPGRLSTTANSFTIDGNMKINRALTIGSDNGFSIEHFPNINSFGWIEDHVLGYKNWKVGYLARCDTLYTDVHLFLELGTSSANGNGDGTFLRYKATNPAETAELNSGIALKLNKVVNNSPTLEIHAWDPSGGLANLKAESILATTYTATTINATTINATTIIATSEVSSPTFNSTSDRRLKTNIQPWTATHSILDLPVYSFDYIADNSHHIGCLAQDLQSICPELVNEDTDGYLHIEESKLIYLLMQEVRELKQQVLALSQK